jgi:DNA-binding transcriptional LysR family regulator
LSNWSIDFLAMKRQLRSSMTLSQLRVLLAVAEYNSFSEAALKLNLSQSSVSSAIAMLEDQLGTVLFSRGRHGARLTPVGERIIIHARKMVQLQEEMLKEARLANSLKGGNIRIASFRSLTTHVLSSVIAQFRQRFPEVSISILEKTDTRMIEDDLRQGRADVGFIDNSLDDGFEAWEVLRDEYVVLIPDLLEVTGATLSWAQLSSYPLIMFAEGDIHDEEVYAHCASFGQTLTATYHVSADSSIVSMVAQGLGVTIMPRLAAEPIPPNVQVYSLPVPLFRIIWVAVLANALLSPPVFAFLDMVKSK